MLTTLKRINVGSAFRVGVVLYGLLFLIFGALFVIFQGLLLNGLSNLMRTNNFDAPNVPNASAFLGASLLSLLCFYGVGVVAAAIFGGIQFAIVAFFYNLTANWVGGIKLELQTDDSGLLDDIESDLGKRKRDDL